LAVLLLTVFAQRPIVAGSRAARFRQFTTRANWLCW
jgi:hypothetical protein